MGNYLPVKPKTHLFFGLKIQSNIANNYPYILKYMGTQAISKKTLNPLSDPFTH